MCVRLHTYNTMTHYKIFLKSILKCVCQVLWVSWHLPYIGSLQPFRIMTAGCDSVLVMVRRRRDACASLGEESMSLCKLQLHNEMYMYVDLYIV